MTAIATHAFAPRRRRGAEVAAMGILWDAAIGVIESLGLPTADGTMHSFAVLLAWNTVTWSVVGLGIAFAVEESGRRLEDPRYFALFLLIAAVGLSGVASLLFAIDWTAGPGNGTRQVLPHGSDPLAAFLYQAWIVAFYGGLYALARTLHLRTRRTRALLRQAEIARRQGSALLTEVQLAALRGKVDPALLLSAMQSVEERYAHDRERADVLVDRLVAFLRLAMPSMRGAYHTLPSELALARAHASLRDELDGLPARLTFDVASDLPAVPFPPLMLGPILDALGIRAQHSLVRLAARLEGDHLVLVVDAKLRHSSGWLPDDLAYRLRVGLRASYGERFGMQLGEGAGAALVLTLPVDPRPLSPVPDPREFPFAKG